MSALLVISRAFLFGQNCTFAVPQFLRRLAEDLKAVFKIFIS